ncbi:MULTISPECIES: SDR family NAD(P)-dependent oxidoreductase [Pseudonocardia]|uniref:Rhamnolipids biosynthesis 3-oxoacyl-[acyl-carrier-protein] reductase n=2 Tax=Pseudonocardia TaxID=1847 RepID=A0A1Y2MR58_PSEAH|nr:MULTISPECIES: SDR family NAD(P)-dependent oxidoreductase [Pseudonocardia]OSY37449.1 Rhamnolipids biosynthesis 3-oxoacyl-[acyl-carrier-protein] reductase [Pseudonocardia autotrophica]TDN77226.1 NAD(P)-dependent dehydrogenase (short-subunit alcohol dehydrogenase family) [Pseudonocardia autotrophica]BBG01245.1 protochlorophyllide reductase [Pseudonocardia autotrophica]GEC25972.1 protochlorophyllide reductase [Pseudonocardia saturnea]
MYPLPDLAGRTVLVTGTTSGLGLALSGALAGAGARVLMAARDTNRGQLAAERAGGELVLLDLADLSSVRSAALEIRERTGDRLDVLVNNAGVAMGPRAETTDGFELQIGTNHLGPAALTWLLMPALRAAGDREQPSRVVTTTSLGHRTGRLDVDDLHWRARRYSPNAAYGASKLANLLFAAELDRRLRLAGDPVLSVAAHPGMTESSLLANSFRRGGRGAWKGHVYGLLDRWLVQPVEQGIGPQLAAATGPVHGGDHIGPSGPGEMHGPPGPARRSTAAQDPVLAGRLWHVTAAATGITPDPGRTV